MGQKDNGDVSGLCATLVNLDSGEGVMGMFSDGTIPPVVVPVYIPNTPLLHDL